MKTISNYSQPEFYSFSEDSLELARFALEQENPGVRILDLCAGCGIIGLEYALGLNDYEELHFLELQKEFIIHLEKNIASTEIPKTFIHQNSIGEAELPQQHFEVILCNPPYFVSGDGRVSPDLRKQLCRTFEVDGWDILLSKICSWLKVNGKLFISVRNLDPLMKWQNKIKIDSKKELGGCWLVALTRLDVD